MLLSGRNLKGAKIGMFRSRVSGGCPIDSVIVPIRNTSSVEAQQHHRSASVLANQNGMLAPTKISKLSGI